VTFSYKDYRHQDDPGSPAPIKTKTLPAVEFIRRKRTPEPLLTGRVHKRMGGMLAYQFQKSFDLLVVEKQ